MLRVNIFIILETMKASEESNVRKVIRKLVGPLNVYAGVNIHGRVVKESAHRIYDIMSDYESQGAPFLISFNDNADILP